MTAQLTSFPTEAGVYPDIPEGLYHRQTAFLSSTGARTLAHRTPAHFDWQQRHPRKPKTTFDIGTAAHAVLLGRGAEIVVVNADDWRSKDAQDEKKAAYAAGKTPLLIGQWNDVQAMADAVREDPVAGKLFGRTDCQPEVTVIGQDPETGVWCRARVDWLLPIDPTQPLIFVDLKTSGDDVDHQHLEKSLGSWNYHQQIDHYADCLRWALDLEPDHPVDAVLVAVEKDPEGPHLVNIGQPNADAMHYAHQDNRKARYRYARYSEQGHWPGHMRPNGDEPLELSLPPWLSAKYHAIYPSGEYDPDFDFESGDFT